MSLLKSKYSVVIALFLPALLMSCHRDGMEQKKAAKTQTVITQSKVDTDKVNYAGAVVYEFGQGNITEMDKSKLKPIWKLYICLHRLERGSVGEIEVDWKALKAAVIPTDFKDSRKVDPKITHEYSYEKSLIRYTYSASIEKTDTVDAPKIDVEIVSIDSGSKKELSSGSVKPFTELYPRYNGIFNFSANPKHFMVSGSRNFKIEGDNNTYYFNKKFPRFFNNKKLGAAHIIKECEERGQPYFFLKEN